VTPAEFWALTVHEFWWLLEANKVEKVYGKKHRLTQSEADQIVKDLRESKVR